MELVHTYSWSLVGSGSTVPPPPLDEQLRVVEDGVVVVDVDSLINGDVSNITNHPTIQKKIRIVVSPPHKVL